MPRIGWLVDLAIPVGADNAMGFGHIALFAALSAGALIGAGALYFFLRGPRPPTLPPAQLAEEVPDHAATVCSAALCMLPVVLYLLAWSAAARRLPPTGIVVGLVLGAIVLVMALVASSAEPRRP
ncbi:MAG: hypothetical protein FJZ90_06045 [Chloroflexi bacterium]|nr:hypothetical protein [Chloroflexota bacterium]